MRWLIDNPVSWRVGRELRDHGNDVVHIADRGMESHDDRIIFELAAAEQRIVLTQDSDFGPIHTAAKVRTGVLLLRLSSGRPSVQAGKVLAALPVIERALLASSMVILLDDIAWIANPST